jgi:hypothetical protein
MVVNKIPFWIYSTRKTYHKAVKQSILGEKVRARGGLKKTARNYVRATFYGVATKQKTWQRPRPIHSQRRKITTEQRA